MEGFEHKIGKKGKINGHSRKG